MKLRLRFGIFLILFSTFFGSVFARVPQDYYPNYNIVDDWDIIIEMLTKIISHGEIYDEIPTEYFENLNKSFEVVMEYFPQQPDFKIVYEKCKETSSILSKEFDRNFYLMFSDSCYKEINQIIETINSEGTVKAEIKSIKTEGNAPLNITLDARGSKDPSVDTIPTNNYFWYYRDMNANDVVIGKGPVVNHTFDKPGRYEIHLTVRSSNRLIKGVFDGEQSVTILVAPKSANIVVYVNSRKLDTEIKTKIDVEEAKRGVLFDGSATTALGERTIKSYSRLIEGGESFVREKEGRGDPEPYRLQLYEEGVYSVKLMITDNEGNKISEEYQLFVSDPIARVKLSPNEGTTNQKYTFDASASYSSEFKIKSYKWIVYSPDGVQIDTYETKNFTRSFRKSGIYTIRLTVTDQSGRVNDDQAKFTVKTTQPIAMFTETPIYKRKYPSQFIFDASSSYDIDVVNKVESLEYSWGISNEEGRVIEKRYDKDKKILVTFNEVGTFVVTLTVDDQNGGVSQITKEFEIESTLRPELSVSPRAVIWGNPMKFMVESTKSISSYKWDFGDGKTRQLEDPTVLYTYDKIGIYDVKLTVSAPSGEQNEVSYQAFVGERGYPIGVFMIKVSNEVTLYPENICTEKIGSSGENIDYPAYSVERYEKFTLDASESLNSKGLKTDLRIYFEPKNDNLYEKKSRIFDFSELGCTYIDVTVEDLITNKLDKKRIRFKVRNSLPKVDTIDLSFPQFGNESGIGFNQAKGIDMSQQEVDPLIVKVSVNGAIDPDGQITQFVWYYYEKDTPENLKEVKITPQTINYAMFALPRISGKYVFGVKIVDNDDASIKSEDILGMGPMIVFPPGNDDPNVPFVTLKTKGSQTTANVGDEIEFQVNTSILSERRDFTTSRVIKYDFDGDGEYDLTSKKDTVKHIYDKPGNYKPKVKVVYRGKAGVGFAEKIEIQKGLKANFLYSVDGHKIIMRDFSYGDITKKLYCMDLKECKKDPKLIVTRKDYFEFDYETKGLKFIRLELEDEYANSVTKHEKVLINTEAKSDFKIMSVPELSEIDGKNQITIGENLDNSILYYIVNNKYDSCFVDFDISHDSNGDGNPSLDHDLDCNELRMHVYNTNDYLVTTRIYFDKTQDDSGDSLGTGDSQGSGESNINDKYSYIDIDVELLDVDNSLMLEYKEHYDKITSFIKQLEGTDSNISYLKTLLINLRTSLGDQNEMDGTIMQIEQWFDENIGRISQDLENDIKYTTNKLKTVELETQEKSAYEVAKMNILTFISENSRVDVETLFDDIQSSDGNRDNIKENMQKILDIAIKEVEDGNLEETDLNIIKKEVCVILDYYSINSTVCSQGCQADIDCEDGKVCSTNGECVVDTSENKSIVGTIIKVVLIILGVLFVLFIILTIIFAIKAKQQQAEEPAE